MELRKIFLLKYLDFYNKCKQDYNIYCSMEIENEQPYGDDTFLHICLEGTKDCIYFNKDFDFYLNIFLKDLETYFRVYYGRTNSYYDGNLKKYFSDGELAFVDITLYEKFKKESY